MTTISFAIPEDRLQKLNEMAAHLHVAPEELIRASVEDLLIRPEEEFRHALDYVLEKNTDLYQRLA